MLPFTHLAVSARAAPLPLENTNVLEGLGLGMLILKKKNVNLKNFSTIFAAKRCLFQLGGFEKLAKALSKQEGPKICWDACFWHVFFLILISCLLQTYTCKNDHISQ